MVLREIKSVHALDAGSTDFNGRWILQQWSLCCNIHENACAPQLFQSHLVVMLFNSECYG
jgi:hypothetical protein